jgi:hypothetical protein
MLLHPLHLKKLFLRSAKCWLTLCCIIAFVTPTNDAMSQIGGRSAFEALRLSPSARATALGGTLVSQLTDEPLLFLRNPAVISDSAHNRIALAFFDYIADIGYSSAAYTRKVSDIATFSGGVQYFSFGTFNETDAFGNLIGDYRVSQTKVALGAKRQFGQLHYGMNAQFIQSQVYNTGVWAFAVDAGALYDLPKIGLSAGMALRNVGAQINRYSGQDKRERLPIELEVGVSYRLPKAPLRFTLTGIQLQQPTLIFQDPNQQQKTDLLGRPIDEKPTTGDQIMRHLMLGVEINPTGKFTIRGGYNHLRSRELRSTISGFGFRGFSLGVGLRIVKNIQIDYGFGHYFLTASTHQFQVSFSPHRFKSKKANALVPPTEVPTVQPSVDPTKQP